MGAVTNDLSSVPPALTVGFDLDMTLIDSRPGIKAVYDRLAGRDRRLHRRRPGRHPARAAAGGRAGATGSRAERIAEVGRPLPRAVPRPRHHPDARDARRPRGDGGGAGGGRAADRRHREVRAQRRAAPGAPRHRGRTLRRLAVGGGQGARRCASTARPSTSATTSGDVRGARTAGALSVAVATGPCDAAELRAAGADVVLDRPDGVPRLARRLHLGAAGLTADVHACGADRPGRRRLARAADRSSPPRRAAKPDAHQHAARSSGRRQRVGAEEQRGHGDQSGHGADEEDDRADPDQHGHRAARDSRWVSSLTGPG